MNWPRAFKAAEKRGYFTRREIETAAHWNHCAVGENIHSLSNHFTASYSPNYDPDTNRLDIYRLGVRFFYQVHAHHILEAKEIHDKIVELIIERKRIK